MTAKRFTETLSTGIVTDNVTGKEYKCEMRIDDDLLKLLNGFHEENQKLQNELETYKSGNVVLKKTLDKYEKLMRKHNIGSIEKLDKLLTWERRL